MCQRGVFTEGVILPHDSTTIPLMLKQPKAIHLVCTHNYIVRRKHSDISIFVYMHIYMCDFCRERAMM